MWISSVAAMAATIPTAVPHQQRGAEQTMPDGGGITSTEH